MTLVSVSRFKVGYFDFLDWLEANVGSFDHVEEAGVQGDGWFLQVWENRYDVEFTYEDSAIVCLLRWS